MADMRFTPAQQDAILSRGGTVLVSAAAGSGKTRVLTERLMAYLTDRENPVDVDQFLIITFTRAAAGELRARVLGAIADRIAADPENRALRRQSALCARAQIGTIHSFCGTLLREHCAEAGLAPDFTIVDDQRAEALMASALEKTLDLAYASIEEDAALRLLADTVGAGRDDRRLAALVRQLYDKMQSHPRPEVWAERQISRLRLEGVTVSEVGENKKPIPGSEQYIKCDTLLFSVGLLPENELSEKAGVDLDGGPSSPKINDQLATSIPGVFACGNVLHVHDLVDYVSEEADRAGTAAARFVRGEAAETGYRIPLRGKNGVRYTVPQFLDLATMPEEITVRFRVNDQYLGRYLSCYVDGKRISHRKKKILTPGEMEQFVLKREVLDGDTREVVFCVEDT